MALGSRWRFRLKMLLTSGLRLGYLEGDEKQSTLKLDDRRSSLDKEKQSTLKLEERLRRREPLEKRWAKRFRGPSEAFRKR